jgi:hypothetical protein
MRRKMRSAIPFLLGGFIVLNGMAQIVISYRAPQELIKWRYVAKVAAKSRKRIPGKVVVLGDSVADQLFPAGILRNSLTTNGAVLMCGQYILAYNALTRNPKLKYLVLMINPQAIGFGFERGWTYSSFVKPFYTPANLGHFSGLIWSKMRTRPLSFLAILPLVKVARCFSDIRFPSRRERSNFFSDVSLEYLRRIEKLAAARHVQLLILSPPVPAGRRSSLVQRMRLGVSQNHLESCFRDYFERMIFIDDQYFRGSIHLQGAYLAKNRLDLCRRLLPPIVWSEFMRFAQFGPRLGRTAVTPGLEANGGVTPEAEEEE